MIKLHTPRAKRMGGFLNEVTAVIIPAVPDHLASRVDPAE